MAGTQDLRQLLIADLALIINLVARDRLPVVDSELNPLGDDFRFGEIPDIRCIYTVRGYHIKIGCFPGFRETTPGALYPSISWDLTGSFCLVERFLDVGAE